MTLAWPFLSSNSSYFIALHQHGPKAAPAAGFLIRASRVRCKDHFEIDDAHFVGVSIFGVHE